jgi:hypothetical protein
MQSAAPDKARIVDSLAKIKSRGLKQRLKRKAAAMGIAAD